MYGASIDMSVLKLMIQELILQKTETNVLQQCPPFSPVTRHPLCFSEDAVCTATYKRFLHADNDLGLCVIELPCLTTASAAADYGSGSAFQSMPTSLLCSN